MTCIGVERSEGIEPTLYNGDATMKGRATSSERHTECERSKGLFAGKGKKAVLFVSFALVLAAFLGAGVFGNGDVPDQTLGAGAVGEREYLPEMEIFVIAIGDVSTVGGEFTMEPGFLYKIEVLGGAGANGGGNNATHIGGNGGDGAVIAVWLDLRTETASITYTYNVLAGGAGGATSTGTTYAGGAGGAAVAVYDDYDDLVIVAAGGGGGGGAALYGNGGNGSAAVDDFGSGPEETGADGNDAVGVNAGGGGGSGAGYPAGNPGAGGGYNAAGKGGKGGLSYVDFDVFTFEIGNKGAAGITVTQYDVEELFYVSGTVYYADNTTVFEGAEVWYAYDNGIEGFVVTDSDGYYEIEVVGDQELTITDVIDPNGEYENVTEMPEAFTGDAYDVDFVMYEIMPVVGMVVGNYNNGIEGVAVAYTVLRDDTDQTVYSEGIAYTDVNGEFTIKALQSYTVAIESITKDGYRLQGSYELPEYLPAGDDPTYVMDAATTVTGKVLNKLGFGLGGVTIDYEISDDLGDFVSEGYVLTDVNGNYVIDGMFENDTVVITGVSLTGYRLSAGHSVPLDDIAAGAVNVDFEMDALASLTITVKGTNDVGITGVTVKYKVTILGVTGAEVTATTNGGGTLTISGIYEGDTVEITSVTLDGYKVAGTLPRTLNAGQTGLDTMFTMLAEKVISGTVKYPDGSNVPSFTINYSVNGVAQTASFTNGVYSLTVYETENITITAVLSGCKTQQGTVTFTGINENKTQNFVLLRGFTITGTVVCGDAPLKDVEISYTVNGTAKTPVKTDANGVYQITGLYEGDDVTITDVKLAGYTLAGELPGARNFGNNVATNFEMTKNADPAKSNTIWFVILALILIVAAVLAYFFFFKKKGTEY